MIARVGSVGAILVGTLALGLVAAAAWALPRPRADRDWAREQATAPEITFDGDTVRVRRLRDFRYTPDGSALAGFRDEAFPLDDVRRVWFALAPFARRYRGLAHSFVTFEFAGGRFVAVSVEARREEDERYSLLGGLLRSFELAYVVGTEEDLLGVRAQRGDTIFLYPSVTTPEQARAIFLDMMVRARDTQERPEFYNTLLNNCNTNLRRHVNRATSAGLPWGWGVVLPGFSDALALERGLLDTPLPLERARERFRVDEHVRQALAGGAADFSLRIRAGEGA
ncbi:MAG TPA: DUF4105 domain-containing protein [Longimicrobiales bacterium]|nr:DUF4105 domain-containing protein [Longimicrobiales bacterium]